MEEEIAFSSLEGADVEEVLEIERASFPSPWTRGMFMEELSRKDFAFFITGKIKNRIISYGGFWLVLDEAHLGNLAVHPDFRRQGIGERTLKELIGTAKSNKAKLMTLEVRESNEKARALYKKFGFKLIAMRKKYYSDTDEDAYVYIKDGFNEHVA